jgi:hypothetical protein
MNMRANNIALLIAEGVKERNKKPSDGNTSRGRGARCSSAAREHAGPDYR